ncbi:phenoloxidase-activating enzyme-like isoform X3 [Aricia agestis]|uniref:phenoloxidase-activating enzyme-like isoform X3 n=1 Tax=Aricia agestis TaxID=91739 RepID=UPI001C2030DF|nr:phenoloxidase-activating enzyme-like isoform X3 [Aricia agestis]
MKPLLYGVWCALLGLHISDAQEICKTPTKLDGRCIPIDDCKHLKPFGMKSAEQREYLKLSTCGYIDQTPLVCCPNNTLHDRCVTFSGEKSTCRPLESCPIIRKKLETRPLNAVNMEYVQRSRCHNSNKYYCCDPVDLRQRKEKEVFERLTEDCLVTIVPSYNKSVRDILINIHPWIGIIEYADNGPRLCVGSLINKRYVLTAAHCLVSSNNNSLRAKYVRFGDFDITSEGPDCTDTDGGGIDCTYGELSIEIESFVIHPEYNTSKTQLNVNDIGLIRLLEPVPYNDFILPNCLPRTDFETSETPAEISFSVAGWGHTNKTDYGGIKLENYINFIDRETCVKRLRGYQPAIGASQICAGGGHDEHVSDSGGPLILYKGTFHGIVGVFSFRPDQCAADDCPDVYTKVYDYLDWIKSNIKL